jgi:two-component system sporulation sensor kinase A
LVADAYLDFAHDCYSNLLKRLSEALSQRQLNPSDWFAAIEETIKVAGLSWVVAHLRKQDVRLGDIETWEAIQRSEMLGAEARSVSEGIKITRHPEINKRTNSHHALQLDLSTSGGTLWLGVERLGFGPELDFSSPWRNFLIQLAQIADAAILRITAEEEFQRLQIEAAQFQGLSTVAVTTGTLVHQLSNQTQGQLGSISTLLEALQMGQLTAEEDIVQLMRHMKTSAEQMQSLLLSLTNVTKIDYRRPCHLLDAAIQARTLFATALLQKSIRLEINVKEDIWIDVPFYVACLALANLIGNAKDAMGKGGTLSIEAEIDHDCVVCRVVDEGEGVPTNVRDRLFQLGTTSKVNGSGWGLYLTRRALLENRSQIELTTSDEKGSTFTLRFPKVMKEEI